MKSKKYCLKIGSFNQAKEILKIYKATKILPVIYFPYYLTNRLSSDWLLETIYMLESQFGLNKFQTYVEVKKNYGLFINLVEKKINFLSVIANKEMLKKLKSMANSNKVLINPNFSILDLSKTKNIKVKLEKYRLKNI